MDQATRNKLRAVVTQCRKLLENAASQELQGKFGIYAAKKDDVQVDADVRMSHLTDEERAARKDILDHFAHIKARGFKPKEALEQLVREIAYTHLNRFCAYKMMEARQVYIGDQKFREAVSRGVNSNGVKFYLADHPEDERLYRTGNQELAYRHFLDWLGGRLSGEIGVLFSPHDPANRLYPPQRVLDEVLDLVNDEALGDIWEQDETIGWIYQYFTPKELRDQARKESQAPRNSYELAFRNQFFTPRYVVEFLSDNTLGRVWYEMRKGDTKLKDQCRYMVRRPSEVFLAEGQISPESTPQEKDHLPQEEVFNLPVYIPHRSKKDPRDLKLLDPACGSGHFLLYCFDLLLTIYEEAYTDPDLGPALKRDLPTLDALRRDVPRLILAHNLHGIDIEVRASQIAALALWLRCQRSYQELGLKMDRPNITRSNLVCAEPMPGEQSMLDEFVSQLQPRLLGQLVEAVFDKMKLAGEAGSLLRIEEEIRDTVAEARRQWLSGPVSIQRSLFDADKPVLRQQRFDFSGVTNAQFFEQAEAKVVEALRRYAERAENGKRLQRCLFAEEAVRGFAFVEVCHRKFDVVLMNPPFGASTPRVHSLVGATFPAAKNDLFACFVACGLSYLAEGGSLGAITNRTGFFSSGLEEWRACLLGGEYALRTFADLGSGVLDALVETAAYVIECTPALSSKRIECFRVIGVNDKGDRLRHYANGLYDESRYAVPPDVMSSLPNRAFVYWLPSALVAAISEASRVSSHFICTKGLSTDDDFRFLRLWWEVDARSIGGDKRWAWFAKGGEYGTFCYDIHLLVLWEGDGHQMATYAESRDANVARTRQSSKYYFRPAAAFSRRTSQPLSARILPRDCIFGEKTVACFPRNESNDSILSLVGYLSSGLGECLGSSFTTAADAAARTYESGIIATFPFSVGLLSDKDLVSSVKSAWQIVARCKAANETSTLYGCAASQHDEVARTCYLAALQEINCRVSAQSGIQEVLENAHEALAEQALALDYLDQGGRVPVSLAFGIVVGRWDVRLIQAGSFVASLPEPFAPLPPCPPAVLKGDDGFPLREAPAYYPVRINWEGIVPDDPEHPDDIARRVRNVIDVGWKAKGEAVEREACESLGVKDLRDYFRKPSKGGFWDDHISRYSKSRRKAPIYWLLQSSKKNYALWLYYHRLDKDLLFKALVNYVEPKIRLEESRLEALRTQKAAAGGSGGEAKRLGKEVERQEDFLSELHDFADKLRRAANLHLDPDLNDGVVLNIAPLWELVPWKEAKKYWDELLEGKYEWSSIGKQLREKGLLK